MLPIGTNTSAYVIQPPLVNTTTPGTGVVHVPPDNVAPSVSGSQVDNNSKNNSTPPPGDQTEPAPEVTASSAQVSDASNNAASSPLNTNVQASFIAQLAAQDDTQETNAALQQYEKLIEYSNVKYKPSYAFKPQAAPSDLFGRLLNEKTPAQNAEPAVPVKAPVS